MVLMWYPNFRKVEFNERANSLDFFLHVVPSTVHKEGRKVGRQKRRRRRHKRWHSREKFYKKTNDDAVSLEAFFERYE